MKASIIRIGNSRGIRIPKPVFEQCGFKEEVEMRVQDNQLVICAPCKPRAGWVEAFQSMTGHGDDELFDHAAESSSTWDETGWEWK